jgi:hypothetical protein
MQKYLLLFTLALVSLNLSAQRHKKDFKKIESFKIQYLTETLDLSPEKAQKFWPVYNEYQKKTREILKGKADLPPREGDGPDFDSMSDKELETKILEHLNDQKKLAEIKIQYFDKFKTCLGTRGAARYYKAELDFHRRIMRELGGRGKNTP